MNAIILAAGMGTRLRPLTENVPKALVRVGNESFFERQLRLLAAAGVSDVTIVTGYKAEAFRPWQDRPGIRIVHNERYADWNNLYSMYLVRDRLGGTIVLDGDVWIGESVLPREAPAASRWYVGHRDDMRNEWAVVTDDSGRVGRIDVRSGSGWILTGISYWSEGDGPYLAALMERMMSEPGAEARFWDEAPRSSLGDLRVEAQPIGPEDWAEIDTVAELEALKARIGAS